MKASPQSGFGLSMNKRLDPSQLEPSEPREPPKLSKADQEALRQREKEMAKQKEMMRKSKIEMANEKEQQIMSGIGNSGVKFDASSDLTSAYGHGGPTVEPRFNPYDQLAGTTGKLPSRKFSPISVFLRFGVSWNWIRT